MELHEIFQKWKINHNLIAELIDMPKGTFNNKLNPEHDSFFKHDELMEIQGHLKRMIKDISSFSSLYLQNQEDLIEYTADIKYNTRN